MDEHARECDEELKKQLDEEKFKLDEEYQKIRRASKEMAEKYKKEYETERSKVYLSSFSMFTPLRVCLKAFD